jgi:hypothetical protein
LSFEMQVSQSSSISKALKMKSIVWGDISICCESWAQFYNLWTKCW